MMTRMREIAKKKNQKGLAIVEYVIVLAVVAALAATVFSSGDDGISKALTNKIGEAKTNIDKAAPVPKP